MAPCWATPGTAQEPRKETRSPRIPLIGRWLSVTEASRRSPSQESAGSTMILGCEAKREPRADQPLVGKVENHRFARHLARRQQTSSNHALEPENIEGRRPSVAARRTRPTPLYPELNEKAGTY